MSEDNKEVEESPESETSVPIMTIVRIGLMAYLAYVFYDHMGAVGIVLGLVLGLIPILGGAALLAISIWGDKFFG